MAVVAAGLMLQALDSGLWAVLAGCWTMTIGLVFMFAGRASWPTDGQPLSPRLSVAVAFGLMAVWWGGFAVLYVLGRTLG